jgi:periplasmic protein TonB
MNWTKRIGLLLMLALAAFAADEGKRLTRAEALSAVTEKYQPSYPALAKQLKVSGTIDLEAVLSETGVVEKVNVISGNLILTKAGAEALIKWKFRPVLADGKPVKAIAPVQFTFTN